MVVFCTYFQRETGLVALYVGVFTAMSMAFVEGSQGAMIIALASLILCPFWHISICLHSGTEWVLLRYDFGYYSKMEYRKAPVMDSILFLAFGL